jgi:hypothetical protein
MLAPFFADGDTRLGATTNDGSSTALDETAKITLWQAFN